MIRPENPYKAVDALTANPDIQRRIYLSFEEGVTATLLSVAEWLEDTNDHNLRAIFALAGGDEPDLRIAIATYLRETAKEK